MLRRWWKIAAALAVGVAIGSAGTWLAMRDRIVLETTIGAGGIVVITKRNLSTGEVWLSTLGGSFRPLESRSSR